MNKIILAGKVYTEPEFSHEINEKKFYKFFVETFRTSGTPDILPVIAEKTLFDEINKDDYVKVIGEIRTRNIHNEDGIKLEVKVHAKEFLPYENEDENDVTLEGFICKNSFVRRTPFGRKILDTIIASHRKPNVKFTLTDYIPCVFWGKAAEEVEVLTVGSLISLAGRLQSRDYKKKLPDGTVENRVAYELSISEVEI